MGVVLRAHPVRGESHIQPNANGEVATNKKHKAGAFQSTVKHRWRFSRNFENRLFYFVVVHMFLYQHTGSIPNLWFFIFLCVCVFVRVLWETLLCQNYPSKILRMIITCSTPCTAFFRCILLGIACICPCALSWLALPQMWTHNPDQRNNDVASWCTVWRVSLLDSTDEYFALCIESLREKSSEKERKNYKKSVYRANTVSADASFDRVQNFYSSDYLNI